MIGSILNWGKYFPKLASLMNLLSSQGKQHLYGVRKQAFLQTSYAITKEVSAFQPRSMNLSVSKFTQQNNVKSIWTNSKKVLG